MIQNIFQRHSAVRFAGNSDILRNWFTRGALAATAVAGVLSLPGCALSQLKENSAAVGLSALDIVKSQIISNLIITRGSPYAIPSQVSISSGSITTTDSITPNISGAPLDLQATNTVANTVAAAVSSTTTHTTVRPNATTGVSGTNQRSLNLSIAPEDDPDQLARLRAIYRFGAGRTARTKDERQADEGVFACEYPLVQKAQSSGQDSNPPSVINIYTSGTAKTAEKEADEAEQKAKKDAAGKIQYTLKDCDADTTSHTVGKNPDPEFLQYPGCVICDNTEDPPGGMPSKKRILRVNPMLLNRWAIFSGSDETISGDATPLGSYDSRTLFLKHGVDEESKLREDYQKEYSDYVLFVLQAGLMGGSSPKGTSQKTPSTKIQPQAAPTLQLE